MHLYLDDIIRMGIGAIVNVTDTDLRHYPGICDAIFTTAGTEKLERVYRELGRCHTGQAVVTPGCGPPCRCTVHVAGPDWYGGEPRERLPLAGCYQNTLHKTYLCSYRRAAVLLIFSGGCHMPQAASLRVAEAAIADFCRRHPSVEMTLVLYRQGIYDVVKRVLSQEDAPS